MGKNLLPIFLVEFTLCLQCFVVGGSTDYSRKSCWWGYTWTTSYLSPSSVEPQPTQPLRGKCIPGSPAGGNVHAADSVCAHAASNMAKCPRLCGGAALSCSLDKRHSGNHPHDASALKFCTCREKRKQWDWWHREHTTSKEHLQPQLDTCLSCMTAHLTSRGGAFPILLQSGQRSNCWYSQDWHSQLVAHRTWPKQHKQRENMSCIQLRPLAIVYWACRQLLGRIHYVL